MLRHIPGVQRTAGMKVMNTGTASESTFVEKILQDGVAA